MANKSWFTVKKLMKGGDKLPTHYLVLNFRQFVQYIYRFKYIWFWTLMIGTDNLFPECLYKSVQRNYEWTTWFPCSIFNYIIGCTVGVAVLVWYLSYSITECLILRKFGVIRSKLILEVWKTCQTNYKIAVLTGHFLIEWIFNLLFLLLKS